MSTNAVKAHRNPAQYLAAGLTLLALVAASAVPARAQAQIGGALPNLATSSGVGRPAVPQYPTLVSPLTATPLTPAAPAAAARPAAPAAAPPARADGLR